MKQTNPPVAQAPDAAEPKAALRSCECLLRHAGDFLRGIDTLLQSANVLVLDAEGVAQDGGLFDIVAEVHVAARRLDGVLSLVRQQLAAAEAEARR